MKRDPEKARKWQRRSAARAAEKARERAREAAPRKSRSRPLRASPRRKNAEGPLSPEEWAVTVWRLDGGRCIVTAADARWPRDFPYRFQVHHPIEKSVLRARGLYDYVWDPRNGVIVATRVHERHTNAVERIPLDLLPARCREFSVELGPWAEVQLERTHPPLQGGAAS